MNALFGEMPEECPQCGLNYVDGYNLGYALGKNDERVRLKRLLLEEIDKYQDGFRKVKQPAPVHGAFVWASADIIKIIERVFGEAFTQKGSKEVVK